MEKGKVGIVALIIVAILTLVIGIGIGFAVNIIIKNNENKNVVQDIQKQEKNEISIDEVKVASDERKLTDDELDLFENYLNTPTIWNFLSQEYRNISEFKLGSFLKYYDYTSYTASDAVAKEITGEENLAVPITLYQKDLIDGIFKKYTGKDVSILKTDELPLYSEKYKCYFNGTCDYHKMEIDVVSGTEINDKFVIRYTTKDYISKNYKYGETITFELTLNKVNGVYQFVSNVIV